MVAKITITEGEFAGWQTYDLHDTFDVVVTSTDRAKMLRKPRLH